MSLVKKVQKYIHLRHEYPFFSDGSPANAIPDSLMTAEEAQNLTKNECVQMLEMITKAVVRVKSLTRSNEMIMVLAFVLKHLKEAELKNLVYNSLLELLTSFDDVTLFLMYRTRLNGTGMKPEKPAPKPPLAAGQEIEDTSAEDNTKNEGPKSNLSSGLRRFLQKWYNNCTVEQLAQTFSKHRKLNGWSHRDIMSLAHIKFEDPDKIKIIELAFHRPNQFLNNKAENETNESIHRLINVCRLRTSEDVKQVADIITQFKLNHEHLPTALYGNPDIWEKVLPQMTYKELLNCLPILEDLNLLDPKQPFAKKLGYALGNHKTLKESKLHPYEIYSRMKLYEHNERYMDVVKETHRKPKVNKTKIITNKEILKKLKTAFEQSFECYPQTGQRIIITIDNRHGMYKKKVLSKHFSRHISCIEVSLIIALTYMKREKDVKILSFSENDVELLPLQKTMTFDDARKFCETRKKKSTKHSLDLPFKYAKENKLRADVFLTINDSVLRCAPMRAATLKTGTPLVQAICAYKKSVNISNIRHVIVGLASPKRCFEGLGPEEGRTLEVAGFTGDTVKIVEEFMKGIF